jgi:hypothetical protein
MTPEDDWLRTVARENEAIDHARRIQPGRGHQYRYQQDSDWWILALIAIFIIAGIFG